MDLVIREDEDFILVEHKTSAKKYGSDQLRWDFRVTPYELAFRELGWNQVGLRYQVITKTKSPQVQIENVRRDRNDECDFRRLVLGVLKSIDAGVSFPVRGVAVPVVSVPVAVQQARAVSPRKEVKKKMAKKLSVSDELHTLDRAVEAARDLARHAEESTEDEIRFIQPKIGAVLALVAARLHDFDRVVRGELDPATFMAVHSGLELEEEEEQTEVEDILLDEWPPEKRRANAEWELKRAEALEKEVKGRR